jgi:uncharacterized protein (DUF58 family)
MHNRELSWLDPAVIAGLGTLELKARAIVEGFLAGLHRSPLKGFSVEFAEYRAYMPGDDLTSIDWKVYARTDRFYVKKFEQETNVECRLLLDVSASMAYQSAQVSKLEYGSYLAASLAYLMTRQRDAVGLTAFDNRIVDTLPVSARPGHLHALLAALSALEPGTLTDVSKPLHQLADLLTRRGIVVVISDLLDDPPLVVEGLKHLRFKGTEVIVFHLLDHAELTFPFDRPTRFRDLETAEEVAVIPSAVREQYLASVRDMIEFYKRELGAAGIDYLLVDTAAPLDLALMAYLAGRRRWS